MITFLTIENNNLNIQSYPWIKSDRDSIRNSCDVFLHLQRLNISKAETTEKKEKTSKNLFFLQICIKAIFQMRWLETRNAN